MSDTAVSHPPGKHYNVRGHRLWVESEGSGTPLLLLAGFGPAGSHVIFHPAFTELALAQVLYVDLYGRGRSERPTDLETITFPSDVADIAALIGQLDLGPVNIYGFSYGGLIGQALALDHPHLVRSLILANTLHSPEMWQHNHVNINREIANQLPEIWDRILELRRVGLRSTDQPLAELFARAAPLVRFHDPTNASRLPTEPGARNLELYALFAGADVDFIVGGAVTDIPDFRPRLKEITVPTMVIAGRYDRALHPRLQREFVEFNPRFAYHLLEHSGSFSHIEEPHTVLQLVREFLELRTI